MESWITQSGFPVVQVDVNGEESTITLTQVNDYIFQYYFFNDNNFLVK